jgi:hypothetical protein
MRNFIGLLQKNSRKLRATPGKKENMTHPKTDTEDRQKTDSFGFHKITARKPGKRVVECRC